jgi:hypothetical protein
MSTQGVSYDDECDTIFNDPDLFPFGIPCPPGAPCGAQQGDGGTVPACCYAPPVASKCWKAIAGGTLNLAPTQCVPQ